MGHPILRVFVQPLHVTVSPCEPDLAQRRRVAGAQAWVAADAARVACARQTRLGALADQRPFELGRSTQNLQSELALGGRRCRSGLLASGKRPPWLPAAQSLQEDATATLPTGLSARRPACRPWRCAPARGPTLVGRGFRPRPAPHGSRHSPQISGPATGAGGSDPRWIHGHSRSGASKQSFSVSCIATKRPFVNECKGVRCGAARQKALGFHALNAIGEISPTIACACYIESVSNFVEIPWVICIISVFCTYGPKKPCFV